MSTNKKRSRKISKIDDNEINTTTANPKKKPKKNVTCMHIFCIIRLHYLYYTFYKQYYRKKVYSTRKSGINVHANTLKTAYEIVDCGGDDNDENSIKWNFPQQYGHKSKTFYLTLRYADEISNNEELNDEVINFSMFNQFNQWNLQLKNISYVFTTYFWSQLKGLNKLSSNEKLQKIKKISKFYSKNNELIKKKKYLIIPQNQYSHWRLVIIDTKNNNNEKAIIILDSIHKSILYYSYEFQDITIWLKSIFDTNACYKRFIPKLPQQQNSTECGLFLLQNMKKFGQDKYFDVLVKILLVC